MTDPAPLPDSPATLRARACARFLEALALTGNVSAAARAAGVHRSTPYEWRDTDPAFAAAWAVAEETATDALEAEARRRAIEGWDEPVFRSDGQVGTIRRYSDRMLEILLKGHRPRFREGHRVEVSGPGGGAIPTQVTHDASPEFVAQVGQILAGLGIQLAPDAAPVATAPAEQPVHPAPPDGEAGGVPRA